MTLEDKVISLDAATAVLFVTLALTLEDMFRTAKVERRDAVLCRWEADVLARALKVADELPDTELHRHGVRSAELMLREIVHNVRGISAGYKVNETDIFRNESAS